MNLDSMARRLALLTQAAHSREEQQQECGVVIYNPETGEPCPGYEHRAAIVRLPDNGRGGIWLPEKYKL